MNRTTVRVRLLRTNTYLFQNEAKPRVLILVRLARPRGSESCAAGVGFSLCEHSKSHWARMI